MEHPYRFGRFTLDPAERKLCANGVPVPLGTTDFRLLHALVERAGTVVTKDDLVQLVWGRATVSDNALYVHINTLRKVLGNKYIVNKQGYGYRFIAPLRQADRRPSRPTRAKQLSGNLPSLWVGSAAEGPARLIGRSEQLSSVSNLLRQGRLVTLTGPGGVGKTRLALQAAGHALPQFSDGVWLIEMAALTDPDLVVSAIASVLSVRIGAKANPLDTLRRYLAEKSLLLVFDNCEHVIEGAAGTAEQLLSAAAGSKILATSREPLSCSGEQVIDVPPLALVGEGGLTPDVMRNVAAVDLFIERAIEADTNFRVSDAELAIVAKICRRVDGLPLAIEMAAGWAGPLGLEALDAKLDGSLKAWLRARSTAPARHSTLRATIEWSHGLLTAAEQSVLRHLAVFAGSFSMEGAEAVAGGHALPKEHVFECVGHLIRKSMIAIVPGSRPPRFRLLETTRAFLLEELIASGEGHTARRQHSAYVLRVLETAIEELETTSDGIWLDRYGPMLDDLRAALDWAMEEDSDMAVAIAGASWPLWRELSLRSEGRRRLGTAAGLLHGGTPPMLEARLRRGLGEMLLNTAAMKAAHDEFERAAILYRGLDDRLNLGGALAVLGHLLLVLNKTEEACQTMGEALGLLERAGWLRSLAAALSLHLCIEATLGRVDDARAAGEKAARLSEMAGCDRIAFVVAANLVQLSVERGDISGAIPAARNLTARLRDTRHSDIRGFSLGVLAAALTARGEPDEALTVAREAAPLLRDEGTLTWLFDHLALRAMLANHVKDAALVAGYAHAAYKEAGRAREPMGRRAADQLNIMLRSALPDDEIALLADLGAHLTEDQAIALALGARQSQGQPSPWMLDLERIASNAGSI